MTREAGRRHVWVTGVVQGVGFRYSANKMARRVGVAGWVRNLDDGRVEAVFEGELAAVEAAVTWCRSGPAHAVVQSVEVDDEQPEGLNVFRVLG